MTTSSTRHPETFPTSAVVPLAAVSRAAPKRSIRTLPYGWLPEIWLRCLALLAVAATLMGRAIAPALPGSMTGIGRWIVGAEDAAAFLSQLFAVSGAAVLLVLLLNLLRSPRVAVPFRMGVAPASAAICTLVVAAAAGPIDANWTLGLGLLSAALAAAATPLALRAESTRGVGIVLGLGALAALVHVGSRLIAVQASIRALPGVFTVARGVATAGLVLDLVVLLLAFVWAVRSRILPAVAIGSVILALSATASWGALRGVHYEASTWQVLAARTLAEFCRHPMPLVDPSLRFFVDVATWSTTVGVLLARGRGHAQASTVALVLLAHHATDIPALAMAMALAGLLAPLCAAATRRSYTAPLAPDASTAGPSRRHVSTDVIQQSPPSPPEAPPPASERPA